MTVFAPQILFSWEEVLKELNETANNDPACKWSSGEPFGERGKARTER
jgi:hypothetical protein